MFVDVHAHIAMSGGRASPPPRVARYAALAGIDHVLVSNRDAAPKSAGGPDRDEVEANGDCLAACAAHPRLLPLYRVRPGRLDSSFCTLAGALTQAPFAGAVVSCAEVAGEPAEAALLRCLSTLDRLGKPLFFHVRRGVRLTPARIFELAQRYPRLPVVICHAEPGDELRYQAREALRSALGRQSALLYLDTAYFSAADVAAAVRDFGVGRLLFGSDALALEDAHTAKVVSLIDEVRRAVAPGDFRAWAGENAARLLGLGRFAPAAAAASSPTVESAKR